jgi:hypothetical protein
LKWNQTVVDDAVKGIVVFTLRINTPPNLFQLSIDKDREWLPLSARRPLVALEVSGVELLRRPETVILGTVEAKE